MPPVVCEMCHDVCQVRNYRVLSQEIISDLKCVLNEIGFRPTLGRGAITERERTSVCRACFTKLNRARKLTGDLERIEKKLQDERNEILYKLREKYSTNEMRWSSPASAQMNTPRKCGKRALAKTPTPKKAYKKHCEVKTPTPKSNSKKTRGVMIINSASASVQQVLGQFVSKRCKNILQPLTLATQFSSTRESGTQTDAIDTQKQKKSEVTEDFEAKVIVKYTSQKKVRIIRQPLHIKICKSLIESRGDKALANILYQELREHFCSKVLLDLEVQLNYLSSQQFDSVLRKKTPDDLLNIDWASVTSEWKEHANILYGFLKTACSNRFEKQSGKLHHPAVGFAGAVMLFHRNPLLSRVQHAFGLILDQCGATDEAITILHGVGATVASSTVHAKKSELLQKHDCMVKDIIDSRREQLEVLAGASQAVNLYQPNIVGAIPSVITASKFHISSPRTGQEFGNISAQSVRLVQLPGGGVTLNTVNFNTGSANHIHIASHTKLTAGEGIYTLAHSPVQTRTQLTNSHGSKISLVSQDIQIFNKSARDPVSKPGQHTVMATQERTLQIQNSVIRNTLRNLKPAVEFLGDNFDMMVSPSSMTIDKQRKSWNWFLVLASVKRVLGTHLPNHGAKHSLLDTDLAAWLPSRDELQKYKKDIHFHIVAVLVKYIKCLEQFRTVVPEHIEHPYMAETSKKSRVINCELIDSSESSTQGIIEIMQRLHSRFVPHNKDKDILERSVLGGDVYTNDCAFSAQRHMINGSTDFDKCAGVTHRPEGLHLIMNFIRGIYQLLYKEASSSDRGTLYQLRNIINRRNVSGPDAVIKKFRSHHDFVEDCLDAYIVAAACVHFGMNDRLSQPTRNWPSPVLHLNSATDQYLWLTRQAASILEYLLVESEEIVNMSNNLREKASELADIDRKLADMKRDGTYHCSEVNCNKVYQRLGNLKTHLKKAHNWLSTSSGTSSSQSDKQASGRLVTATFVKMALLARDTYDAYRHCDGDRVFRNIKQIFLYSDCLGHTKYKLWTWRMIAYENSVLTPREAFEYKWNIAVNLQGGAGQNIPNDNCVELQVANIKKLVQAQGSNKSFSSAQTACKTSQIITEMKTNMMKVSQVPRRGKNRPPVDKGQDIDKLVTEILQANILNTGGGGRHLDTFDSFRDPLSCINMSKLMVWMKEQKDIMSVMYK